jgi:hypothetical protein
MPDQSHQDGDKAPGIEAEAQQAPPVPSQKDAVARTPQPLFATKNPWLMRRGFALGFIVCAVLWIASVTFRHWAQLHHPGFVEMVG